MIRILPAFLLSTPLLAFAQDATFKSVVGKIVEFNQLLVISIFAITFVVIVWKVVDAWILHGGDPASIEKGKKVIGIGIIVLVVMSGLWGILELLLASFQSVAGG